MPAAVAYLVVFAASFCALVLELVAGRILAPYIGVSLYTWTSIIGVVLAGISLGNYLGGRVADRWPRRRTLGVLLAAGGIASLAILPLINIATAIPTTQITDASNALGGNLPFDRAALLIVRIVVVTAIIFLPPSLLLGMVSPVVIRLTLHDMAHAGGTVGKIYALSTLGSIVGTFATGFVLVQAFGTRMIVVGVAAILLAMAFVLGDLLRARAALVPLLGLVLVAALLVPARNVNAYGCLQGGAARDCMPRAAQDGWTEAVDNGCLHETAYYCIKVVDHVAEDGTPVKELVLDHLVHSYNDLADPNYLEYGYIKVYAEIVDYLAQRLPNRDLRVLYVGGGGYTLARHIEATYPNAHQEIMEIDPGVTQTVYEQLGVDPSRTHIVTYNVDARLMVNQLLAHNAGSYDLIIGDAFNDLSIPYHLTTREFDQSLEQLLKPDGYYLALVIDKLVGGRFLPAYASTVESVWPYAALLAEGNPWQSSDPNTIDVLAGNQPLDMSRFSARVTTIMPADQMRAWLTASRSPLLTDDYAPVDNLIAPLFADRGF
jgi:spermidine synthase